jgi:GH24 family phage-related lysozyme (muramidase)
MMQITDNFISLVKQFEGCKLEAYKDSGGVWTIGYGHTKNVEEGDKIEQYQAEMFLKDDTLEFVRYANFYLRRANKVVTQNQFDAIVDLIYNRGIGTVLKSSTWDAILSNNPNIRYIWENEGIKDRAGNKLNGLIKRRKAEVDLYLS